MDNKLIRAIHKKKKKEIKQLRDNFEIGLIRNAAFSVGTEFYSAQVALNDKESLPIAVPLLSHISDEGYRIENYQPFRLARALYRLKVPTLFVATDSEFLGGDHSHVNLVKTGSEISVIQRDFIIDEAQIYTAKSIGADGLLLDSALLDPAKLAEFTEITFAMGMEPFLKLHAERDLEKVELELIGGVVLEKDVFRILQKGTLFKRLREIENEKIPILMIHDPASLAEIREWEDQGVRQFLLPDDWLLQENPILALEQKVRQFWPMIFVEE